MLVSGVNAANIHLLPFNGNIIGFENGLNGFSNFGTDSVALGEEIEGLVEILIYKGNGQKIPGIRVTVYLPPYLVGLKISDWTVAKANMVRVSTRTYGGSRL